MSTVERVIEEIKKSGVAASAIIAALRASETKITKPRIGTIGNQQQAMSAGPGDYKVKGSPGLYLRKGEGGSGSWRFRFRFGGKRPQMGLGALADVTLAQARAKADELRPQVRNGVNPILARRAAKIAVAAKARADAIAADGWTFARAADEYLRAHARSWKHRDAVRTWHNPIVKYA